MRHRSSLSTILASVLVSCLAAHVSRAQTQRLTLRDVIAIAQRQGFQAQMAVDARDASRARDRSFGANLLPQISLGGNLPVYNRSIVPVVQPDGSTLFRAQQQNQSSLTMNVTQQLPFTGGQLVMSSGLSRVDVIGASTSRTWSGTPFSIGIRQSLLRSNSASWDAREQGLRADISERQYLEAREDAAIAAATAFFDVFEAQSTLDNALSNAAVNDTLYTLNKGRFEVGKIGENDLLSSELQLLRARTAVDGARLNLDRALAALRLQLGLPIASSVELVPPDDIPDVQVDTLLAVTQAMRNSSTVRNAEFQDVDAERRVSEARFNSGPGATIQASVGFNQTGPEAPAVYKNLLEAQTYSVGVQVPLWQWGAHGAQVQAAKLDQHRATLGSRQSREQTAQDAHFAALQLGLSRRQLELSAKADTVANKSFDVASHRYVIGRISLNDLFTAQTAKDQAVLSYVQALRGYWTAYYRLRRVTLFDFIAGREIR